MRKKIIAGNWKMNKTPSETVKLIEELKPLVKNDEVDVVFCVPAISLTTAIEAAKATIDDAQKNIAAGTFTSAVKSYSSVPKEAPAKEPPKKASVSMGDFSDLLNAVEAEAKKEG